jgi:hypothetical protein
MPRPTIVITVLLLPIERIKCPDSVRMLLFGHFCLLRAWLAAENDRLKIIPPRACGGEFQDTDKCFLERQAIGDLEGSVRHPVGRSDAAACGRKICWRSILIWHP